MFQMVENPQSGLLQNHANQSDCRQYVPVQLQRLLYLLLHVEIFPNQLDNERLLKFFDVKKSCEDHHIYSWAELLPLKGLKISMIKVLTFVYCSTSFVKY